MVPAECNYKGLGMNHTDELAYSERVVSDWASGAKPMTERAARDIEQRLGLPPGWLDKEDRQCTPIFST
jgi:hypothetical protein